MRRMLLQEKMLSYYDDEKGYFPEILDELAFPKKDDDKTIKQSTAYLNAYRAFVIIQLLKDLRSNGRVFHACYGLKRFRTNVSVIFIGKRYLN